MKILDLGCGNRKIKAGRKDEVIGIDFKNPIAKPDVSHDLNKLPYPFDDNTFDFIYASYSLEHLDNPLRVMEEMHRIAKPNARIVVKVPHYSYGWANILHKKVFGVHFIEEAFTRNSLERYSDVEFKIINVKLSWIRFPYVHKFSKPVDLLLRALNHIFSAAANVSPIFCERVWCYWVGGFEAMEFELKVVK